jgi:hypothetical protein
VLATGNALLSCAPSPWRICTSAQHRAGLRLYNDDWWMRPYDTDHDPLTAASSSGTITIPAGATVTWAGLYWSGSGAGQPTALLKHDSSVYKNVQSTRLEHDSLRGHETYQAFADVTDQVSSGGTWSVGLADKPTGGFASYAGWSLVVVVHDDSLPERQVAVFDGLGPVDQNEPLNFDLDYATQAGPGQVTSVAWEGDDGLTGDHVDLDGAPLAPCSGTACDMEDSSATGATSVPPGSPWNTFGTDVHTYPVQVSADDAHHLSAGTVRDAFSLGVVGVALPMP